MAAPQVSAAPSRSRPVPALPLGRLGGLTATIRRYRDGDQAAVYQVCVETANAGRGVHGRYSTDDLVPDTVAGPYLFLEPEHAYVLDNGGRAVGYVIGTASTPISWPRTSNGGCRGCGPGTSRCPARR